MCVGNSWQYWQCTRVCMHARMDTQTHVHNRRARVRTRRRVRMRWCEVRCALSWRGRRGKMQGRWGDGGEGFGSKSCDDVSWHAGQSMGARRSSCMICASSGTVRSLCVVLQRQYFRPTLMHCTPRAVQPAVSEHSSPPYAASAGHRCMLHRESPSAPASCTLAAREHGIRRSEARPQVQRDTTWSRASSIPPSFR